MKNKKNQALKIGAVFSILSFLLTFTIAGPMLSVMPAIFLENVVSNLFADISYAGVCKVNLLVFCTLFVTALFLIFKNIKKTVRLKQQTGTLKTVAIMLVIYLLVHPIGYYVFLWFYGFPSDALNAIMSVGSFPFTSLSFISIGFVMDWQIEKSKKSILV